MSYVCLLTLYQVIVTIEKNTIFSFKSYVSFIEIAGIRAFCMLLNLIKFSSDLNENC